MHNFYCTFTWNSNANKIGNTCSNLQKKDFGPHTFKTKNISFCLSCQVSNPQILDSEATLLSTRLTWQKRVLKLLLCNLNVASPLPREQNIFSVYNKYWDVVCLKWLDVNMYDLKLILNYKLQNINISNNIIKILPSNKYRFII